MNRLRTAVIGCGHLGRIHARLLTQHPAVELCGVVDPASGARESLAQQVGCPAYADVDLIPHSLDAIVLAAPTSLHFSLASRLIERGIHLLVEKPLAPSSSECEQLITRAARAATCLAVGHVERFNPAFTALTDHLARPLYLEAVRSGPFSFRSMDSSVIMDLMIHDLDLALALIDSPVVDVAAIGSPVVTSSVDYAEARVTFANGSVARFFASRVTPQAERRWSLFSEDRHAVVDWNQRTLRTLDRCEELIDGRWDVEHWTAAEIEPLKEHIFERLLPTREIPVATANPLLEEQADFIASILQHRAPRVSGEQGLRAVRLAEQIQAALRRSSLARGSLLNTPRRAA